MARFLFAVLLPTALVLAVPSAFAFDFTPREFEVVRLNRELVLPYPLENIFRGYGRCKRGRHTHRALDIGGVGPNWGLGTPVRAMAKAKVIHVGTPESDPKRYGTRDIGPGTVVRGKTTLPKQIQVRGYGAVHPFTRNYGRLRTGVLVVTRGTDGRMKGHEIKYMHLAALHPDIKKGVVVEAGQELGLMGGTAVQTDPPHLHLAIENRAGNPIDPARILGIGSSYVPCSHGKAALRAGRTRLRKSARDLMRKLARTRAQTPLVATAAVGPAEPFEHRDRFEDKVERAHRFTIDPGRHPIRIRVDIEGPLSPKPRAKTWHPRIKLLDRYETLLFDGTRRKRAGRKMTLNVVEKGRRAAFAELVVDPGAAPIIVQVGSWRRRPPRGATYRLSIAPAALPSH